MDRLKLPVTWMPRLVPLAPVGVAAWGTVATALANRLLNRTDDQLAELAGVEAPGLLIVLSDDPTFLPWAEGAIYLGRDAAAAPSLLLPTTHYPSVPLPVLERAIRARFPELSVPLAVLPDGKTVVSVSECRKPMVRATLQAWKELDP